MNDKKTDKAKFVAWMEDIGLKLNTSSLDEFVTQFKRLKETVGTEDIAKQIVYDIASGKDVPFYPQNEEIVTQGSLAYLLIIIKKQVLLASTPNGKQIITSEYIGRTGRPKAIPVILDEDGDVETILDEQSEEPSYSKTEVYYKLDVKDDESDDDPFPTYVRVDSEQGLKRIKEKIKTVIIGHITNRFKELAGHHAPSDVHEMADYLIEKIREIEARYTE